MGCNVSTTSNYTSREYIFYSIVSCEYLVLAVLLVYFLCKSSSKPLLNYLEYKLYLMFMIISCILKIILFLDPCSDGWDFSILLLIYAFPLYSSQTILIYLW